jgi:hypothetical protein
MRTDAILARLSDVHNHACVAVATLMRVENPVENSRFSADIAGKALSATSL